MTIQELLPLLHQLPRADKLRALQYLANDLATTELGELEQLIPPVAELRIYTPYGNEAAARQLLHMLDEAAEQEKTGDSR